MSNRYNNFVKASSSTESVSTVNIRPTLTGDEAKRIYLEEIKEANSSYKPRTRSSRPKETVLNKVTKLEDVSYKDLFVSAEKNDVATLSNILDVFPNMLNITDDYGWSLLMIACQANSVEAAKELLKRGIDTSIRDKAGNSARSLVIKNRNLILADLFLSYKDSEPIAKHKSDSTEPQSNENDCEPLEKYVCEICNCEYPDKEIHLSSTIHNICASKGKKIPIKYKIPQSNRGFQIMLKVGWDRDTGLGRNSSGRTYPIKAVQKKDRTGLGHEKKKEVPDKKPAHVKNKKMADCDRRSIRRMEKKFRREFY